MAYFDLEHFYDPVTGAHRVTPEGMKDLEHLITIVLNKHFSKVHPDKKDDLRQLGWYKVFKTFSQGTFDPNRSSLKNYLYTGIRNEMGNFITKGAREQLVDNTLLEAGFLQNDYDTNEDDPVPEPEDPMEHEQQFQPRGTLILHKEDIEEVVRKFQRIEQVWNRLAVYFRKFGISVDWGERVGSSDEEGSDISSIAALCVWHYRRTH